MNRTPCTIVMILSAGVVLSVAACDNRPARPVDPAPAAPAPAGAPQPGDADLPRTSNGLRGTTPAGPTAGDQSERSEHIKVTADIRRALMEDDSISTRAKNCTIVTDSTGTVTLRGSVQSQAEKESIEAKARSIAGAARVVNQLVVDPG